MATVKRPAWVKPGQQWSGSETFEQYKSKGRVVNPSYKPTSQIIPNIGGRPIGEAPGMGSEGSSSPTPTPKPIITKAPAKNTTTQDLLQRQKELDAKAAAFGVPNVGARSQPTPQKPSGTTPTAPGTPVRIGGTLYPSQQWYDLNVAGKQPATTGPAPWQSVIPADAIDDETGIIHTDQGDKKLSEITDNQGNVLPGLTFVGDTIDDEIIGGEEDVAGTSDSARQDIVKDEADEEEDKIKQTQDELDEIEKLTRQQQIQNLRTELGLDLDTGEPLGRPEAPTLRTDFEALRDEQGITAIEEQINTIEEQIRDTEASLRQGMYDQEGKLMPMELIDTRQRELQRQAQEGLDTMNRRKQTLVDELSTKNTLITNIMNMTQSDYSNASSDYTSRFNEQISLINILEKREGAEQQEENRIRDDSRANLTIITNIAKESGQTWDELDAGLRVQMAALEAKAGLPIGITQAFMNTKPDAEVMSTTTGYNSAGEQVVTFIYKGTDGKPSSVDVIKVGGRKEETEDDGGGGGAIFQAGDEQIDLSTNDGLIKAKELGYVYEDVYNALDQNTKLSATVIKEKLDRAGFITAGDERNKVSEIKELNEQINEYKNEWKSGGDKDAGTREDFINAWAEDADHLSKDEIRDEVYKNVSDKWLSENEKKGLIQRIFK